VIAVDTNILVYAHREDSDFHDRAATNVRELAEGAPTWAIPWPCIHEFVAVVTHPRIYAPPTSMADALEQVAAWLESPSLMLLGETADHWATLRALLSKSRLAGPAVHDARVAAICLQHGVRTLWTADRDFSRFPRLPTFNPLVG